ncbi:hypothetical protein P4T67_21645, partial [Bacillus mycoides]|nr:hypothetical protein [Bacillus mycoides]
MINQIFTLHISTKWKRFLIIFFLTGITIYNFEPTYIENIKNISMEDWLLEISGSLLVIYF